MEALSFVSLWSAWFVILNLIEQVLIPFKVLNVNIGELVGLSSAYFLMRLQATVVLNDGIGAIDSFKIMKVLGLHPTVILKAVLLRHHWS